jgi:hypothetical protein
MSTSRIRFAPKSNIQEAVCNAGLEVETWLGDWQGTAWTPDAPEIIPLGRLFA